MLQSFLESMLQRFMELDHHRKFVPSRGIKQERTRVAKQMPECQMKSRTTDISLLKNVAFKNGQAVANALLLKSFGFEARCFEIFVAWVTIETLTETGNCARQTSGTQGRRMLNAEFNICVKTSLPRRTNCVRISVLK